VTFTNSELFYMFLGAGSGLLVFIGMILRIMAWLVIRGFTKEMETTRSDIKTCNSKIQIQISSHERRITQTEMLVGSAHRRMNDHINDLHAIKAGG